MSWQKSNQEFAQSSSDYISDLSLLGGIFMYRKYQGGKNHANARKYAVDFISEEIQSIKKIIKHLKNNLENQNTTITISKKNGLSINRAGKLIYYKANQDRLKVIMMLESGLKSAKQLMDTTYSEISNLSTAVSEINRLFRMNFDLEHKLILHQKNKGYMLNPVYTYNFLTD